MTQTNKFVLLSLFAILNTNAHNGPGNNRGIQKIQEIRAKAINWDECGDSVLKGQYQNYDCINERPINPDFKVFLDDTINECVEKSLAVVSNQRMASNARLIHAGIIADSRQHSKRSLHQVLRSLDLRSIEVMLENGEKEVFKYSKAANDETRESLFYASFRSCYGLKLIDRDSSCTNSISEGSLKKGLPYFGTSGKEEKNRFLNLSLPFCSGENSKFFFSI